MLLQPVRRLGALALCLLGLSATGAAAQKISLDPSVTIASRWIWRGLDLGQGPQIQPMLALNVGRFQTAVWGSHPIAPPADDEGGGGYRETNWWAQYTIPVGIGTLTPYVQNHYNPNGNEFFKEDSHVWQAQLMFAGNESLPFDAMIGYLFANAPENSIYLEAGARAQVGQVPVRFFIGGVPEESGFYATDKGTITNVGFSAGYDLPLTETFRLPLGVRFILNPYTEETFSAFTITLRP